MPKPTQKDLDYIYENYNNIPIERIAKHVNKSPSTIRYYARKLGIKGRHKKTSYHRKSWTKDEDNRLKELYRTGHKSIEIAKIMGRTYSSIEGRLSKLRYGRHKEKIYRYIPNLISDEQFYKNWKYIMMHMKGGDKTEDK